MINNAQGGAIMSTKIHRMNKLFGSAGPTGLSKSAGYQAIAEGLWTRPVKVGKRAAGCPENELVAQMAARIAGKSESELRALVVRLHAARAQPVDQ